MENSLGIIGGGQLGRMLAIAAKSMGFRVVIIDPTPASPAGQVADEQIVADFQDADAIMSLAERVSYVTFEIELANAQVLSELAARGIIVHPSGDTLAIIQDKLRQKEFLRKHGIPTAEYLRGEHDEVQLLAIFEQFGDAMMVKARFGGYDGRGNAVVRNPGDIRHALEKLTGRELYAERFINFSRELAVVAARDVRGQIALYTPVETIQQDNVCHMVIAPAPAQDPRVLRQAEEIAREVMRHLDGAGVFGIEMFETSDGQVLVNEIAPRVHNSGHFTIEGCRTSQFSQHVRAVAGFPLGDPGMTAPTAVMVNLFGTHNGLAEVRGLDRALRQSGVSVHIYGKQESRPGRKMGHVTAIGDDLQTTIQRAEAAQAAITI